MRKSFLDTSSAPTSPQPCEDTAQKEDNVKKNSNVKKYSHISKRVSTRWSPEERKKLGMTNKRDSYCYTSDKNQATYINSTCSDPIDLKNHPLSKIMKKIMDERNIGDPHSPAIAKFRRVSRNEFK